MRTIRLRACAGAAIALYFAAPLTAQPPVYGVYLSASFVRLHSALPAETRSSEGAIFGGDAGIVWHRLAVHGAYARGPIVDSDLMTVPSEIEQAEATIGIRPIHAFEIGTGVLTRGYVIDDVMQRWTAWQIHARYELPLIRFTTSTASVSLVLATRHSSGSRLRWDWADRSSLVPERDGRLNARRTPRGQIRCQRCRHERTGERDDEGHRIRRP